MEFVISISRPGKSWNLSEGHGKSWKSNMLGKKMFQKSKNITDESETGFNYRRNIHKHTFYAF